MCICQKFHETVTGRELVLHDDVTMTYYADWLPCHEAVIHLPLQEITKKWYTSTYEWQCIWTDTAYQTTESHVNSYAYLYFVSACNVSSVHCISYSWCSSHKYVANFQAKYVPQRCFYYYSSCNVLLMWAVMISSCSFYKCTVEQMMTPRINHSNKNIRVVQYWSTISYIAVSRETLKSNQLSFAVINIIDNI